MKTLVQIAKDAWEAADEAGADFDQIWSAMVQAVRAQVIEECAAELEEIAVQEPRQHIMMSQRHSTLCAATWVRDLKEKTGDKDGMLQR